MRRARSRRRFRSSTRSRQPSRRGTVDARLFVLVLFLLLVGETLSALVLPIVPGPIVGMGLLLVVLIVRRGVPEAFVAPANGLVGMLTLFIMPASLGILADWQQLGDRWPLYLGVAAGGAVLSAVVAALLAAALVGARRDPPAPARRRPSGIEPGA